MFILQQGEEAAKSAVVGQERILAEPSYPLGTQRLEQDKFPCPQTGEEAKELSAEELSMLLNGIDFFKTHRTEGSQTLYYKNVS
jgi:hypothetical protein